MSLFDDLGSIPTQMLASGYLARAVHGEYLTLAVLEIEPDAELPEHRHDNNSVSSSRARSSSVSATRSATLARAGSGGFRRTRLIRSRPVRPVQSSWTSSLLPATIGEPPKCRLRARPPGRKPAHADADG